MTVDDQRLADKEAIDWVSRRAACTTTGILQLLRERARHEVGQFNASAECRREFRVENGRDRMFGVHIVGTGTASANFSVSGDVLVVSVVSGQSEYTFEVSHSWDETTAT